MTKDDIINELLQSNKNPDDFNIEITENMVKVSPKWSYQPRQLAKEEDIPLGIELSEREIQEITLGQQISDLEIQLLELQLGGI